MNAKPFKIAYELQDMIVEQARRLHGPWPQGMTMFVFGEGDNFYRARTLDLIIKFKVKYDLDTPCL